MKKVLFYFLVVLAVSSGAFTAVAGTLDDAPFQIVLPDGSWKLNDSTAQNMGKGVSLVASITGTNTPSKSVVIKTEFENPTPTSYDELLAGIREQFADPSVKQLSDDEVVFMGFKARRFSYLVNGTTYNVALVFVAGKNGWTVASSGLLAQKAEIQKLITFYHKK